MHTVHGTIRLSVEGRILTIEGQGPWNLESIDLSVDSIGDDLRALYGAPGERWCWLKGILFWCRMRKPGS